MNAFVSTNILLPKVGDFGKWAVIACDQFTSDREYWNRVADKADGSPSTYHVVFPEIDLENDAAVRIKGINQKMTDYVENGVFAEYSDSFVYVERTLLDGSIRPGIVGAIDLEQYHYNPKYHPAIGATEQTVLERVPPRIAVRRNADLEFSHVILFCNDLNDTIFSSIHNMKEQLPKLYDFQLMEDGGHIAAWLVSGDHAKVIQNLIEAYHADCEGIAFLVADGNHSLVTAKSWYEELKEKNPGVDFSSHPARYAMVELENIQDPSICFEPINRVIFNTNISKLLEDLKEICIEDGCPITWCAGEESGTISLNVPAGELPVAVFQQFLDQWLVENAGKIDYIHGSEEVASLAKLDKTIGFILPTFDKKELFAFGASGHILPRKTFSLGHGREKRYYLEGRKIR